MIDALFAVPLWISGLVLMSALGAIYWVGLVGARRWILPLLKFEEEDSNFASTLTQSVRVFYDLVVALIAVSVGQRFGQVSDIVPGEAAAIAALWRVWPPGC